MNTLIPLKRSTRNLLAAAVAASSLMLAACSSNPASPMGATEARAKLSALQNDPNLGTQARVEMREADAAVKVAEKPLSKSKEDEALGKYRVSLADYKVEIAKAKATTRYAEEQRTHLGEQRSASRLAARTREADKARDDATKARASQAEASTQAASNAADLQRQIDELQAKKTERGLVLTLGDVLFTTSSAQLQGNANNSLDKLVNFLNQYPERTVQIEGHTDSMGSAEYNQGLSQNRAESVQQYLLKKGIGSERLKARGIGENQPLADNNTALGRQQNRRVEIIIDQPNETADNE